MGKTILTKAQQNVLAAVAKEKRLGDFYLSGGTALAGYYLYHRHSDDLDFFTAKTIAPSFLHAFARHLAEILGVHETRFEHVHDRYQFFFGREKDVLKVEFALYPFSQLARLQKKDGVAIDSLRDIAANKLMAMLDRFDPKDFVDLYFLLQNRTLSSVRRDAEKKFGQKIDDVLLGSEMAKVQRISALPKMLLPLTVVQLKEFFTHRAQELGKSILH